ncbi:MAG: hypothetical protein M1821_000689 [Bathelium mastoideum]|nr:MAG: hypothetical protein M1821_000689 [Bathelium mastoideum]KAI9678994.1 MAG: hypothetical protein M1822_007420 [Bathelium mastoideum]
MARRFFHKDAESAFDGESYLTNDSVQSFSWEDVSVIVKDRQSKLPKQLLQSVNGIVRAGELLALMGPSGSGKTTLLNVLANREVSKGANVRHSPRVNGVRPSSRDFRKISCFVEQEDALTGALTVRETIDFAAKLSLPSSITKSERIARVNALIASFGLQNQSDTLIGTPIRKGISGGQKRRVSVASQLITSPRLLFLDEPTSGLDSASSYEVISFIKQIAKKHRLLVIASIHQPSTQTFQLFDKLLLLSQGLTIYNGRVEDIQQYFQSIGMEIPLYMNPAEYMIDLVNTDFALDQAKATQKILWLQDLWNKSQEARTIALEAGPMLGKQAHMSIEGSKGSPNKLLLPLTLVHRSWIKSCRDVIAYGIRIAMYMGLAIMMGTVWLRLSTKQDNIQAFINAIFFGGAFMSFMAVAYIPAFLEDRSLYVKERANGLYGPGSFMVANFITGIPFLFIITMLFSIIAYWLCNFRPTGSAFFWWVLWLFLDLLAAESLVVLISSLVPIFVVALAATAFANGLWMSVGGFMVEPHNLNPFWRYVFHYIDYQSYVFQGMMVNEFGNRTYSCGEGCQCMYQSELAAQCKIDGKGVLAVYGYSLHDKGTWVGILVGIIAGYRLLGLLVLYLRRS